ncbi:MAG: hypothetical protein AAF211_11680 [Myxococcota bacterium]
MPKRILLCWVVVTSPACLEFADRGDRDTARFHASPSDDPNLCAPPSDGPLFYVRAIEGATVELAGFLMDEEGTRDGLDGVDVELWSLASDTLLPEQRLASTVSDDDGQVTLPWTADGPNPLGLGVFVHDQEFAQTLGAQVVTPSGAGVDFLCAYWSDGEGRIVSGAERSSEVVLRVEATAPVDAVTRFRISEVGNDLSGNQQVAVLEAPIVQTRTNEVSWTVDAEPGFLEGNALELAFSATAELGEDTVLQTTSPWLRVGL